MNSFQNSNTDFEVRSLDAMCVNESTLEHGWLHKMKYVAAGCLFGIVLIKSEVISWYRIQEMFRFQSFHMFGIIGSAVMVGMLSVGLIKKFKLKTLYGEPIHISRKSFNKGQILGGIIFGLGWAMTGSCPGPLYALLGNGNLIILIPLLSAILGTWTYGWLRDRLPH